MCCMSRMKFLLSIAAVAAAFAAAVVVGAPVTVRLIDVAEAMLLPGFEGTFMWDFMKSSVSDFTCSLFDVYRFTTLCVNFTQFSQIREI